MLEVIEKSEESGNLPSLRILFQVEELALYMLDAWQPQDAFKFPDADVTVAGVTVALERAFEELYLALEYFGTARAVIIEREPSS